MALFACVPGYSATVAAERFVGRGKARQHSGSVLAIACTCR